MKNTYLLLLLFLPLISIGQRKPKIKGNRSVTVSMGELPPFNHFVLTDDLEVTLQKSNSEGYQIEADDNLIETLKFDMQGDVLVLSSYYRITSKKKLMVTVNYTNLASIRQQGGKLIVPNDIKADSFELEAAGDSKTEIRVDAFLAKYILKENAKVDGNIQADSLSLQMSDRADAKFYIRAGQSNINMFGNTNLDVEGNSEVLKLNLEDNAKYQGEKCLVQSAILQLIGSPFAKINAQQELFLSSSGSSKTHFYGNAKIMVNQFLDTSELHKKRE